MSQVTEVETFDLEPGLQVKLGDKAVEVLHLYPHWLFNGYYLVNFSDSGYDGSYKDTDVWEVLNAVSASGR